MHCPYIMHRSLFPLFWRLPSPLAVSPPRSHDASSRIEDFKVYIQIYYIYIYSINVSFPKNELVFLGKSWMFFCCSSSNPAFFFFGTTTCSTSTEVVSVEGSPGGDLLKG